MSLIETRNDLLSDLGINSNLQFPALELMVEGNTKYVQDLRMNVKTALSVNTLNSKEAFLIALSVAANERNKFLIEAFKSKASEAGALDNEIAEAIAITSLLSVNNVLYRFRHFTAKEEYQQIPAKVRMNIMMRPELGKEFFELLSLVISAVNGCEACVTSHEKSLIELGSSEQRIFDAVRIASIIRGLSQVIN